MTQNRLNKTLTTTFLIALLAATAAAQGPTVNLDGQLLTSDPPQLQAGGSGDVTVAIRNTGDTKAENVTVTLLDRHPFQIQPDRQRTYDIGSIAPGQKYYISTSVLVADDAPDGSNDLQMRVSTSTGTRTLDVPLEVRAEDLELNLANVQTQPTTLRPDTEDASVSVTVTNTGQKAAENVVLDLELPHGIEPTSSLSYRHALGTVPAGETRTASFQLDVNASVEPGLLEFPASLTYSPGDSAEELSKDVPFSVNIEGAPLYSITDIESDLTAGKQGQIRVTVENTGTAESTSTRLRVLDNADLPFSFESANVFIGTLEPGDDGTAVFTTTVESDAAVKEYLLDFEARGTQDTTVFVDEETEGIRVSGSSGTSGSTIDPISAGLGGLVVAVLAGAGFLIRRRRQD